MNQPARRRFGVAACARILYLCVQGRASPLISVLFYMLREIILNLLYRVYQENEVPIQNVKNGSCTIYLPSFVGDYIALNLWFTSCSKGSTTLSYTACAKFLFPQSAFSSKVQKMQHLMMFSSAGSSSDTISAQSRAVK
jgi:hypothetical protein